MKKIISYLLTFGAFASNAQQKIVCYQIENQYFVSTQNMQYPTALEFYNNPHGGKLTSVHKIVNEKDCIKLPADNVPAMILHRKCEANPNGSNKVDFAKPLFAISKLYQNIIDDNYSLQFYVNASEPLVYKLLVNNVICNEVESLANHDLQINLFSKIKKSQPASLLVVNVAGKIQAKIELPDIFRNENNVTAFQQSSNVIILQNCSAYLNKFYTLVDIYGHQLCKGKIETNQQPITMPNVTSGIYFINFENKVIPISMRN